MQPALVVILVHGTFARGAPWTTHGSEFRKALEIEFGDNIIIEPFEWSGKNSIFDRRKAAKNLADLAVSLSNQTNNVPIHIIAHSHGGNVALYAADILGNRVKIAGIACMATPFFHASPRDRSVINYKNVNRAFVSLSSILLYLGLKLLGTIVPDAHA